MQELQTLSVLTENAAGVLSQISRLFSRKGYNIDSLTVGETDNPEISRFTIMVHGDEQMIAQIANQLRKLLPVLSVQRLLAGSAIHRELVLFKVKAETRETRDEVIQIAIFFRANVIDVTRGSLTIELTGDSSKSAALQNLYEEFGILEMVRTGCVALERGTETIYSASKQKEEFELGKAL
jgi:acetolactate synthase-1/3 small subunit